MLNHAIRSVTGLLIYVERAIGAGPNACPALGFEVARFEAMVQADEDFAAAGGERSRAWLTTESLKDPTGVRLYRELLERIWPENPEELPQTSVA
jgi:hypothetical protein